MEYGGLRAEVDTSSEGGSQRRSDGGGDCVKGVSSVDIAESGE